MTAPANPAITAPPQPQPTRRRGRALLGVLLAGCGFAGTYGGLAATAPLPQLQPVIAELSPQLTPSSAANVEQVLANFPHPTAVGYLHDPQIRSNDFEKHSIASITKIVTALVCLEQAPLPQHNFTHTFDAADEQLTAEIAELDGVVAPTPQGSTVTAAELLDATLLASANNYAVIYSREVFGSDAQFLAAASDWLQRHGLADTEIADASGLNPANRATTADLIKLGQIALEHPTVAAVIRKTEVTIPGIGTFQNTNPFSHNPDNRGIKTGTLDEGYYNLLAAAAGTHQDAPYTAITVVLQRPNQEQRDADSRLLLASLMRHSTDTLVAAGQPAGTVETWQGDTVTLVTASPLTAELLPSAQPSLDTALEPVTAAVPAGAQLGSVTAHSAVTAGAETAELAQVAVVTAEPITEPDLWWRITHPVVFKWWLDNLTGE